MDKQMREMLTVQVKKYARGSKFYRGLEKLESYSWSRAKDAAIFILTFKANTQLNDALNLYRDIEKGVNFFTPNLGISHEILPENSHLGPKNGALAFWVSVYIRG